jgi:hypothetical protein
LKYLFIIVSILVSFYAYRFVEKNKETIKNDSENPKVDEKLIRIDLSTVMSTYSGKRRAEVLLKMTDYLLPSERKLFLSIIKKSLVEPKISDAMEIVKIIPDIDFTKNEKEELLSTLNFLLEKELEEDYRKDMIKAKSYLSLK